MLSIFSLLAFSSLAQAKEISSDQGIGVGINTWFGDMTTLSVRYSLPTTGEIAEKWELQVEGLAGLSIEPNTRSRSLVGGRILSAIVIEDNLNLLVGGGTGVIITNKTAALYLQPSLEAQFFLFGLDFLSFNAGAGVDITMGQGENALSTSGKVLGGFHYWF